MKRVLCIGGWGHWPEVFETLSTRDDVCVCGIAPAFDGEDLTGICAHELMQDVPVAGSVEELLAIPADFCVISTRPGYIGRAVVQAAEAGLNIISEKPLANSLDELTGVQDAVYRNGVRLMAIFSMRGLAVFQTARRLVQDGQVGRTVLMNARKSYRYGDEAARPEWFGRRSEYSGTFPWIGIHALDIIHFTTGLEPRQVAALQQNLAHPSRPDCEDACCGIFSLDGGAMASVSIDYFRPDCAAHHGDDWVRIVGTEGIVEARACDESVVLFRDTETPVSVPLDEPRNLFNDFLDGRPGLTGTDDAFLLTKACLIARQAADEQSVKEIA